MGTPGVTARTKLQTYVAELLAEIRQLEPGEGSARLSLHVCKEVCTWLRYVVNKSEGASFLANLEQYMEYRQYESGMVYVFSFSGSAGPLKASHLRDRQLCTCSVALEYVHRPPERHHEPSSGPPSRKDGWIPCLLCKRPALVSPRGQEDGQNRGGRRYRCQCGLCGYA